MKDELNICFFAMEFSLPEEGAVIKTTQLMLSKEKSHCFFWDPYKTNKYTVWAESRSFRRVRNIAKSDH